eukprot:TRINITY_DN22601_c0_g1_i1.p1 TRINITY_DN22601_c0_g1~~TRINITY_DN22601_c0_g1_i1.p1  ORF type:complete len:107 (-),score=42.50 TRINITY_DN22601_c0_g1_i1:99-419(-)
MAFLFYVFFFFQAEDGIRDLVRSRGLGDVYKRQRRDRTEIEPDHPSAVLSLGLGVVPWVLVPAREEVHPLVLRGVGSVPPVYGAEEPLSHGAVSYTHLTLPTIYSV